MKKGFLGKRVKELRLSNGFSQEYLADESKLNLRTIQRIESGTTIPRGDTLLRLSFSLKISPDELLDWSKREDTGQLLLINLSGLSFILNPFLGLIIPLALWVSKRDKVIRADETGKELINFQISWLIFMSFIIIVYIAIVLTYNGSTTIESLGHADKKIIIATLFFLFSIGFYYVYTTVLIISNTLRIQKDLPVKYRPSFKILK
jgi:transcriptional regulator with XRE-family HTH domain